MNKRSDIAVVWKKNDKNGKQYLFFKAARDISKDEAFALFSNDKGDNPKRPDYKAQEAVEEEVKNEDRITNDIPF